MKKILTPILAAATVSMTLPAWAADYPAMSTSEGIGALVVFYVFVVLVCILVTLSPLFIWYHVVKMRREVNEKIEAVRSLVADEVEMQQRNVKGLQDVCDRLVNVCGQLSRICDHLGGESNDRDEK